MDHKVGEFEELVLLAIAGLGTSAYAVSVRERLVEASRRSTMGAVYSTLDRLESKGLLRSRMGESTGRQGGKARRFYDLTGTGVAAVRSARLVRQSLVDRISPDLVLRLGYPS